MLENNLVSCCESTPCTDPSLNAIKNVSKELSCPGGEEAKIMKVLNTERRKVNELKGRL